MRIRLIVSKISRVLVRWPGNSFLPSMNPIGMVFTLTTLGCRLETKSSQSLKSKFNSNVNKTLVNGKGKETVKATYVLPLPSPIPAKLSKEVNEISKFFKKNSNHPQKKSYAQALAKSNTTNITLDILKIKEIFPHLQNKKIDQVQKIISSNNNKPRPHINMTMRGFSCKQIIIPINNEMVNKFLKEASMHIININCALNNIKSKVMVDFICVEDKSIIISTNNVANSSDLQEVEKYVKNMLYIEADQISSPRLPQSKSYLKIVGILYLTDQLNTQMSSDNVEKILKNNYIFNDIILVSKPRIIKVSPKLDMSIIWIDIWDTQNGSKAKTIINR